jgi:hypothetical protein
VGLSSSGNTGDSHPLARQNAPARCQYQTGGAQIKFGEAAETSGLLSRTFRFASAFAAKLLPLHAAITDLSSQAARNFVSSLPYLQPTAREMVMSQSSSAADPELKPLLRRYIMKTFILALVAAASIAATVPASADPFTAHGVWDTYKSGHKSGK